jgi:hypothetical protein
VAIKQGASCSLHLCEPENKRGREECGFERDREGERELKEEKERREKRETGWERKKEKE